MSASLAHQGLPEGITPRKLFDLIRSIAPGLDDAKKISRTALHVLEHYIFACRPADFERGRICGLWEQPETIAEQLGISTRVLHNAEAELREHGFIERTHTPHARRKGKRRGEQIVALAGISLKPLIEGYTRWQARRDAIAMRACAIANLRDEIGTLNRQIRELGDEVLIEQAGQILPRGRVSRISQMDRLEEIKANLEALLVLVDFPSGAQKSSHRSEEISAPNILQEDSSQNRSTARDSGKDLDVTAVTPALAARLSSEDYRNLLPSDRPSGWGDIVEASAVACRWHGISGLAWGDACHLLGREKAAVCVLVIDRNARLPKLHRYRARHARACLTGMVEQASLGRLNLTGLVRAAEGHPEEEPPVMPEPTSTTDRLAIGSIAQKALRHLALPAPGEPSC
ncbi:MAG: replication initiation protein RepC [Sphingomonadaceae bacterium]